MATETTDTDFTRYDPAVDREIRTDDLWTDHLILRFGHECNSPIYALVGFAEALSQARLVAARPVLGVGADMPDVAVLPNRPPDERPLDLSPGFRVQGVVGIWHYEARDRPEITVHDFVDSHFRRTGGEDSRALRGGREPVQGRANVSSSRKI